MALKTMVGLVNGFLWDTKRERMGGNGFLERLFGTMTVGLIESLSLVMVHLKIHQNQNRAYQDLALEEYLYPLI